MNVIRSIGMKVMMKVMGVCVFMVSIMKLSVVMSE